MNHLFISIRINCFTRNLLVRANDKLEILGRLLSKKWLGFPSTSSSNLLIWLLERLSLVMLWKLKAGTHFITLLERLSSSSLGNSLLVMKVRA